MHGSIWRVHFYRHETAWLVWRPITAPAPWDLEITKVLSEEALKPENYAIVDLPELWNVAQWYRQRYALDPKTQITSVL